jgi:hypothetical protein
MMVHTLPPSCETIIQHNPAGNTEQQVGNQAGYRIWWISHYIVIQNSVKYTQCKVSLVVNIKIMNWHHEILNIGNEILMKHKAST